MIDEAWCIGCALCLKACPVDAIVGAAKRMHTVIDELCTGCELCVPVCPVDCIALVGASGDRTGWDAWDPALAEQARDRYARHAARLGPSGDAAAEVEVEVEAAAPPGDDRRGARPRPRSARGAVTPGAADTDP